MSSITISILAFAFIFGGSLLGFLLHFVLPHHHLSDETEDVVKLGMGLIGTVAALVLGLLVASAKSFNDAQSAELTEMSSKIVVLDRLLAHYGPETQEERVLLKGFVIHTLDNMWTKPNSSSSQKNGGPTVSNEIIYDKIQELSPKNDQQKALQAEATNMIVDLGKTRWLMFTQRSASVSTPLLVVVIFWLTIIFISFGLFAPRNVTVFASMFFSALAVSGAILLILEMFTPYTGLIQVSSAPLRAALSSLGQ